MHAEMLFIMFFTMILAQILLVIWKKYFPQSYHTATFLGMWLIPFGFSIHLGFVRMLIVWLIFTAATLFITYRATRKPIAPSVPRLVYKYFFYMYKASYFFGILGYMMMVFDIAGFNRMLPDPQTHWTLAAGFMLLFYALYYGVLSRDFAEICASRMASTIGYYSSKGIPLKSPTTAICALCGDSLINKSDPSIKLTCEHVFHEFCIRGWCIVGKKQVCPFCKERVDLQHMLTSPWEKQDLLFSHFLDGVRYLIAWQPAIMGAAQGIIWVLDLH